ncbi:MAG TPA: DUF4349 domain-containing protein [Polyangiaceae bacterium]|nr:DUF4349 domain-containing protein [Polyangiaceae bacterium]
MRTRRTTLCLIVLGALACLQGCGMASAESAPAMAPMAPAKSSAGAAVTHEELAQADAPAPPPPPPGEARPGPAKKEAPRAGEPERAAGDGKAEVAREHLIVYTATITMAVYQVQPNLALVERIAKESGGYLSLRSDNQITVRIPRAKFDAALGAIEKIGDVLHRDVSAEDVTDQYVDLEIRIKNARAMQTRLKQLLEKAAVKEAIEIEKELARVTQELELLEGKLKLLSDKIAYSTITVVFAARGSALQSASRVRLPFPWLQQLGLVNLLQLQEERTR